MKRIHLFEFEDFKWFPNWLRECMTRFIIAMHKLLGSSHDLAKLIEKTLKYSEIKNIIDLGSGSGGPMPQVQQILKDDYGYQNLDLSLSDLYPHKKAINNITRQKDPHLSYIEDPVDASKVSKDYRGVRTIICGFHHMKPEKAKEILKNAQENQQPICIYEISDNSFPKWLWWIAFPINIITVLIITPMIRPMTWQQIVFTYFIPILPILIAWDGAVSNARTYTLNDLDLLLKDLPTSNYKWEKGLIKGKPGNKIYLLGLPQKSV